MASEQELLFLVCQYLQHQTPCSQAAQLLEQEALQLGLLPSRTDIAGALTASHCLYKLWQLQRVPDLGPVLIRQATRALPGGSAEAPCAPAT